MFLLTFMLEITGKGICRDPALGLTQYKRER